MRGVLLFALCLSVVVPGAMAQELPAGAGQGPPPPRPIPGINAPDPHPGGCVDCHIDMHDIHIDARLSTSMNRWQSAVEPELVEMVQRLMPEGTTLKGKHPTAGKSLEDIPAACIKCHGAMAKKAPPFAPLLHVLHFTGAEDNHFMSIFQGECTHCHKLDLETGEWSMPSGPEK